MSDIRDSITDVINNATDKLREYGEIAKLQALIKAEEAKKQDYYYKLGKKYYELYKDAPASDLSEIMGKLITADEKIANYKEDLKTASSSSDKYTDVGEGTDSCSGNDSFDADLQEDARKASEDADEAAGCFDESV